MGEGGGIDHQGAGFMARLMDPVDQLAFVIRLAEHDARVAGGGLAQRLDVGQGLVAIDVRLPNPEKVQIGAVQDVEDRGFGHSLGKLALTTARIRSGVVAQVEPDAKRVDKDLDLRASGFRSGG
ncbi:hypothetical protein D3C80_1403220 [compost metagenome]